MAKKKTKKASSKRAPAADKKIQKQIYIGKGVISGMEKDRKERETHLRESTGLSSSLSWSANIEVVLVNYLKSKKRKSK